MACAIACRQYMRTANLTHLEIVHQNIGFNIATQKIETLVFIFHNTFMKYIFENRTKLEDKNWKTKQHMYRNISSVIFLETEIISVYK